MASTTHNHQLPISSPMLPSSTPMSIRSYPKTPNSNIEEGLGNINLAKTSPPPPPPQELDQEPSSVVPPSDAPTTLHKMIAELVGTFILVFAGCGSIMIDQIHPITLIGISVVWGLAVMVVIYTLGHISGAHINPAITIAFAATRQFPWKQVPVYIWSQVLGSTLAIVTLHLLLHKRVDINVARADYSDPTTHFEALLWESIVSFFLMFVILGVATDHRAVNELSGVAVGATVLFNALIAGSITGASMNPARSLGAAIVSGKFKHIWVYMFGPVLGTVAATGVYNLVRLPVPPAPTLKPDENGNTNKDF